MDFIKEIELFSVISLGLIFGSFATALIYRLPRGMSIAVKRSSCQSCDKFLDIIDLIPVVSWALFRGKCRRCKAKIGAEYVITEILSLILFLTIYFIFGITIQAGFLLAIGFTLLLITVIDWKHYIIPDSLNALLLIFAIGYSYYMDDAVANILIGGMAAFFLALSLRWFMYSWKKKEALGLGDVKFFPSVGILLNLQSFSAFLFLSGVLGVAMALLWKLLGNGERFPFGPSLAVALLLCMLYPDIGKEWANLVGSILKR